MRRSVRSGVVLQLVPWLCGLFDATWADTLSTVLTAIVRKETRLHEDDASEITALALGSKPIDSVNTLGDSSEDAKDTDADGNDEIPEAKLKQDPATSASRREEDLTEAQMGENVGDARMIVNGKTADSMDDNRCLSTDGLSLYMEDCYRGPRIEAPYRQKWYWSGRRLRNREHGICLAMPDDEPKVRGRKPELQLVVEACGASVQQIWFFDDFGRLKTRYVSEQCMDTDRETNLVLLRPCDGRSSQWFSYY
eukprot:TRINITY_DN11075_c0_g1_i1.p1 TRINITY_DN11075_c0_g1~~TRINITY_DN11075_c0_g1_i1.p1  ORF type:complete len:252 (-),score=64.23 TRINITY_DN11075_c0_g1_i1:97-852(-)